MLDKYLNNPYVTGPLAIFLMLYAGMAKPELPRIITKMFNYTWFRLIIMTLISWTATKDVGISIISAMAFIITFNIINQQDIVEGFTNVAAPTIDIKAQAIAAAKAKAIAVAKAKIDADFAKARANADAKAKIDVDAAKAKAIAVAKAKIDADAAVQDVSKYSDLLIEQMLAGDNKPQYRKLMALSPVKRKKELADMRKVIPQMSATRIKKLINNKITDPVELASIVGSNSYDNEYEWNCSKCEMKLKKNPQYLPSNTLPLPTSPHTTTPVTSNIA